MGHCRALTLDKVVMSRANCMLLQKNSPYTATFDREYERISLLINHSFTEYILNLFNKFHRVLLLSQSGISQYIDKKYKSSASMCSLRDLKSNDGREQTSIKLSQFWGIFLILIVGHSVGFVIFLGELLCFNHQRRRRRRQ